MLLCSCAQSVEFSQSVAIFRWLLSARNQNSQDFLPNCHWDFRVLFRNFFLTFTITDLQTLQWLFCFIQEFTSQLNFSKKCEEFRHFTSIHTTYMHARQPLKIENSTIISLYLFDEGTYIFAFRKKTKQKYFGMQELS